MARTWIAWLALTSPACFYSPTGSDPTTQSTTEPSTTSTDSTDSTAEPTTSATGPTPSSSSSGTSTTTDATTTNTTTTAPTSDTSEDTTTTLCGNGALDGDEACDDGDANAADAACTPECQVNVCGDGYHWPAMEACDEGPEGAGCDPDCSLAECGDEYVNTFADEACDDGNSLPADGCEDDCSATQVLGVYAGGARTCALLSGGLLKCWGDNNRGQLGYGHIDPIGDDEPASEAGLIDLGLPIQRVAMGEHHTCAVVEGGSVRCWGYGEGGRLGYANTGGDLCSDGAGYVCTEHPVCCVGDDESAAQVGAVNIGGTAVDIVAGSRHTCVLLGNGFVRCWGSNSVGAAGFGAVVTIGDDETPATASAVGVGDQTLALSARDNHTCAVLSMNRARCWGLNTEGQLGNGNTMVIGDDEPPSNSAAAVLGNPVVSLALGMETTCAARMDGQVKCWGLGGTLGNGAFTSLNTPSVSIAVGDAAVELAGAGTHTCARLADDTIRCWGFGGAGVLGYGNTDAVGDQPGEMPPPPVPLAGTPLSLAAGDNHNCALLADDRVTCWGRNLSGQLGYGHTMNLGDEPGELPTADVPLFE